MAEAVIGLIGGTGPEGRGLAVRFALAGVRVIVGSRDRARARETIDRLHHELGALPLEGADNREVLQACDVMLLTVPFAHAAETVAMHKADFRAGSLVIDVTVPVTFEGGKSRLVEPPEGSGTERVRASLPAEVRLAAAFKTIPAALLARPHAPLDCDDFVCGDSLESRTRTMDLLRLIPGLRPIDAGSLAAARIIERLTLLAIQLNRRYKVHDARFRIVGVP